MPRRTQTSHNSPPAITFLKAKTSYFIYSNQAHSIAECSTATFKAAVLAIAPQWSDSAPMAPLVANPEDLADRWFLLCSLCEQGKPLKLYASLEMAEEALAVRSALLAL
jgi:hypothetical protein